MQLTFNTLKFTCSLSSILFLSACGGTGQDDGSVANVSQTIAGVGVDGHLARATVYLDTNNNGTRDAWEVYAFTDDDGYYSYNSLTDTDYCAPDAAESEALYCLSANTNSADVVLRIDGGYDVLTGEPFYGQLTRRIDTSAGENIPDLVVSPLTSILTDVNESEKQEILEVLGLEESDLDVDYLNIDSEGSIDAELFNTALKIHKAVTILSEHLTNTYDEIGEEPGTPSDASNAVYPRLARQLLEPDIESLQDLLTDDEALVELLDAAEEELREVYIERDFVLPANINSEESTTNFDRIVSIVNELPAVVDIVIPSEEEELDRDSAIGGARTLETVVIMSIEENGSQDPSLDNAIEFITDPENESLVDTLIIGLSGDNADVNSIANNDFSGSDFDSEEEVLEAAVLPEEAEPFTAIVGYSLKISDLDLGTAPNDLKDSEVIFYFESRSSLVEGSFTACVKFIDGANENGDLGDANTRGEHVTGFWSLLGASEGDLLSYSLLMTIEFLGANYQAIIKPYGTVTINNTEYNVLRSDSDGDFRNWYSEFGLVQYESVPSDNVECEAALPSRINI